MKQIVVALLTLLALSDYTFAQENCSSQPDSSVIFVADGFRYGAYYGRPYYYRPYYHYYPYYYRYYRYYPYRMYSHYGWYR